MGLNALKILASPVGGFKAKFNDFEYMKKTMQNPPSNLEVFTSDIRYKLLREEEIYKMTEDGFDISDGKLFKTLCMSLPR